RGGRGCAGVGQRGGWVAGVGTAGGGRPPRWRDGARVSLDGKARAAPSIHHDVGGRRGPVGAGVRRRGQRRRFATGRGCCFSSFFTSSIVRAASMPYFFSSLLTS